MDKQIIYSKQVEISINNKILINDSSVKIHTRTKYAIVGPNGIGKTQLIKHLYNELKQTEDILLIDQDVVIDDDVNTVKEYILQSDLELYNLWKELCIEESKDENEIDIKKWEHLTEEVHSVRNYDKYVATSEKILKGLGFTNPNINVNTLSGGWKMRLSLGRALLKNPKILILDEPTNHLDLHAILWLNSYLQEFNNTLIFITHQLSLVNDNSDVIWFINKIGNSKTLLHTIKSPYNNVDKYITQLENELAKQYTKYQNKLKEFRNSKKQPTKKDIDEFIQKNHVDRPPKPYTVLIEFPEIANFGNNKSLVDLRQVSYSINTKELYTDINLTIKTNDRLVIVGDNGVGKTTLFKLIMNEIEPNNGCIISDDRLRTSYYNQDIINSLPLENTPIEYLQSLDNKLSINDCRTILGKLGIKKTEIEDLPNIQIKNLSGGQKARISFSSIQINKPHLLLLDEPTNHLDITSINALINGINNYVGTILIISHDMHLISSINNMCLYEVKNKQITKFNGDFDEYEEYVLSNNDTL